MYIYIIYIIYMYKCSQLLIKSLYCLYVSQPGCLATAL